MKKCAVVLSRHVRTFHGLDTPLKDFCDSDHPMEFGKLNESGMGGGVHIILHGRRISTRNPRSPMHKALTEYVGLSPTKGAGGGGNDHSRRTIDSRISIVPGRSTSSFRHGGGVIKIPGESYRLCRGNRMRRGIYSASERVARRNRPGAQCSAKKSTVWGAGSRDVPRDMEHAHKEVIKTSSTGA